MSSASKHACALECYPCKHGPSIYLDDLRRRAHGALAAAAAGEQLKPSMVVLTYEINEVMNAWQDKFDWEIDPKMDGALGAFDTKLIDYTSSEADAVKQLRWSAGMTQCKIKFENSEVFSGPVFLTFENIIKRIDELHRDSHACGGVLMQRDPNLSDDQVPNVGLFTVMPIDATQQEHPHTEFPLNAAESVVVPGKYVAETDMVVAEDGALPCNYYPGIPLMVDKSKILEVITGFKNRSLVPLIQASIDRDGVSHFVIGKAKVRHFNAIGHGGSRRAAAASAGESAAVTTEEHLQEYLRDGARPYDNAVGAGVVGAAAGGGAGGGAGAAAGGGAGAAAGGGAGAAAGGGAGAAAGGGGGGGAGARAGGVWQPIILGIGANGWILVYIPGYGWVCLWIFLMWILGIKISINLHKGLRNWSLWIGKGDESDQDLLSPGKGPLCRLRLSEGQKVIIPRSGPVAHFNRTIKEAEQYGFKMTTRVITLISGFQKKKAMQEQPDVVAASKVDCTELLGEAGM